MNRNFENLGLMDVFPEILGRVSKMLKIPRRVPYFEDYSIFIKSFRKNWGEGCVPVLYSLPFFALLSASLNRNFNKFRSFDQKTKFIFVRCTFKEKNKTWFFITTENVNIFSRKEFSLFLDLSGKLLSVNFNKIVIWLKLAICLKYLIEELKYIIKVFEI